MRRYVKNQFVISNITGMQSKNGSSANQICRVLFLARAHSAARCSRPWLADGTRARIGRRTARCTPRPAGWGLRDGRREVGMAPPGAAAQERRRRVSSGQRDRRRGVGPRQPPCRDATASALSRGASGGYTYTDYTQRRWAGARTASEGYGPADHRSATRSWLVLYGSNMVAGMRTS